MNLFTNTEAKSCTMSRCEKITNGNAITWVIGVLDDNDIYYEVILENLSANATKNELQSATITALEKIKKKAVLPVETRNISLYSDDMGLGDTLG